MDERFADRSEITEAFVRSLAPQPIDCNLEKTGPALNQSPSINNNRQARAICPPPVSSRLAVSTRSRSGYSETPGERAPSRASITAIIDNYTRGNYAGPGPVERAPLASGSAPTPSGGLRLNTAYAFDTFATTRKTHLHLERA